MQMCVGSVLSSTVFNHDPIKILSKKEQKLKAKTWITKGINNSIKNKNMFKFAIKDITKKKLFYLKNIEICLT